MCFEIRVVDMNVNIYLEDELADELRHIADVTGKSRNLVIREAIKEYVTDHSIKPWPDSVQSFTGIKSFPDEKILRQGIKPPKEDPFE